jgi:hypothetical protein
MTCMNGLPASDFECFVCVKLYKCDGHILVCECICMVSNEDHLLQSYCTHALSYVDPRTKFEIFG